MQNMVYDRGMKNDTTEQTIRQNLLYDGRIVHLYRDDVLLPNGKEGVREYVSHPGGAAILPVDDKGNVYLVRQFRYPYRQEIYEIPAGKLEPGEDPRDTAVRELEEETGMRGGKWTDYGMLYPTPGYTNEHLYIYLAEDLSAGHVHLDADEFVNVVVLPFDEVYRMVLDNVIKDGKTCYAVLRYAAEHKA